MPWTLVRVVCGLSVTIAMRAPMRVFSRVDFPAFGRPMIDTNPDLKLFFSVSIGRRLRFRYTNLIYPKLVSTQNLDSDSVALYAFAGLGDVPHPLGYKSPYRCGLGVFRRSEAQQFPEMIHVKAARDDVAPLRIGLHIMARFMLIADLTDDLLHHVLHGHETGGASLFSPYAPGMWFGSPAPSEKILIPFCFEYPTGGGNLVP